MLLCRLHVRIPKGRRKVLLGKSLLLESSSLKQKLFSDFSTVCLDRCRCQRVLHALPCSFDLESMRMLQQCKCQLRLKVLIHYSLSNKLALSSNLALCLQFVLFNNLALIYWTFYGVIAVAITPNLIGAAVISGAFYGLSNLFAGMLPTELRLGQLPLVRMQKQGRSVATVQVKDVLSLIISN